jgi:beta-1,4-mannosyl-glycoprotein beta-1,4-N-acetylglucosaminyltransferase
MKIIDCITYFNEKTLADLRFNILDKFIDKFVIAEAAYTHSGNKKKINFNINDYPKFKHKISHIIIDKNPKDLKIPEEKFKRFNSIKRIDHQREAILKFLKKNNVNENDFIIYSDSDEIPDLKNINFTSLKEKFIIFNQELCYYKFNLVLKSAQWYGSRACQIKNLKSISWLRNLKPKKYPFWRIDTYFKNNKERSVKIVNKGGWHFSQLMNPKQIQYKFLNDEHHDEYELSPVKYKKIEDMVKKKYIIYNHHVDKKEPKKKWNNKIFLTQVGINKLPYYIKKNKKKYNNWISK